MADSRAAGVGAGDRARRRRVPVFALLALVVAAIVIAIPVIPLLSFFLGSSPGPLAFESEAWKRDTTTSELSTTRGRMADDLVANHALVGRPWAEVEQWLGPPDVDPYIAPYLPESAKVYKLALTFVDSLWLVIDVSADGTVASARVMED